MIDNLFFPKMKTKKYLFKKKENSLDFFLTTDNFSLPLYFISLYTIKKIYNCKYLWHKTFKHQTVRRLGVLALQHLSN